MDANLTPDNSPNFARYVHQHAHSCPEATALQIAAHDPSLPPSAATAQGWMPCTWSDLSNFVVELILRFQDATGLDWKAALPTEARVAALQVTPMEDVLREGLGPSRAMHA